MNKAEIKISDYDYTLPPELIADRPLAERGSSRMLVYRLGKINHSGFKNIADFLESGDLLILNNTKVIPARLAAQKESGGRAEILLTKPVSDKGDYQLAMSANGESIWEAIIGGKRIKEGDRLKILGTQEEIFAEVLSKDGMDAEVKLHYTDFTLSEILNSYGSIPLPPYMNREADEKDIEDYQTVFAKYEGSVAAPTASLHLTPSILDSIRDKGVIIKELTLHVGPGTFLPVKTDNPTEHDMHSERIEIPAATLSSLYQALESNRRIIASGTTALRTLESLAAIALKISQGKTQFSDDSYYPVEQFPFEDIDQSNLHNDLLAGLSQLMRAGKVIKSDSKLMIMPGHPLFMANGLITNFHLPKSTLMLLVGAFVGIDEMWQIYKAALSERYRFLSYGDGSLLMR